MLNLVNEKYVKFKRIGDAHPFLLAICQSQCQHREFVGGFQEERGIIYFSSPICTYDVPCPNDQAPAHHWDIDMLKLWLEMLWKMRGIVSEEQTSFMVLVIPSPILNGIVCYTVCQGLRVTVIISLVDLREQAVNKSKRDKMVIPFTFWFLHILC